MKKTTKIKKKKVTTIEGLAELMVSEFGRVDERFDQVTEEFVAVRSEMKNESARVDGQFVLLRSEMADGFVSVQSELKEIRNTLR
ncbi:MAG: hypothetical protein AAB421_00110 [Patescibacteria group bacterium]